MGHDQTRTHSETGLSYYAIGDVHGELDKLRLLYEYVADDAARAGDDYTIVHLGDYIDRGPDSRGVVARIMRLQQEASCIALRGNHEQMLLDAIDSTDRNDQAHWALNGGDAALSSYSRINGERGDWRDTIDVEHVRWIRSLPYTFCDDARRILFVHAGIDPWRYPECPDALKIWTRSAKFFEVDEWPERPELEGLLVVHGHTPTDDFVPENYSRRINVDTGACYGGPLTCAVLRAGEPPRFLYAR